MEGHLRLRETGTIKKLRNDLVTLTEAGINGGLHILLYAYINKWKLHQTIYF